MVPVDLAGTRFNAMLAVIFSRLFRRAFLINPPFGVNTPSLMEGGSTGSLTPIFDYSVFSHVYADILRNI